MVAICLDKGNKFVAVILTLCILIAARCSSDANYQGGSGRGSGVSGCAKIAHDYAGFLKQKHKLEAKKAKDKDNGPDQFKLF